MDRLLNSIRHKAHIPTNPKLLLSLGYGVFTGDLNLSALCLIILKSANFIVKLNGAHAFRRITVCYCFPTCNKCVSLNERVFHTQEITQVDSKHTSIFILFIYLFTETESRSRQGYEVSIRAVSEDLAGW